MVAKGFLYPGPNSNRPRTVESNFSTATTTFVQRPIASLYGRESESSFDKILLCCWGGESFSPTLSPGSFPLECSLVSGRPKRVMNKMKFWWMETSGRKFSFRLILVHRLPKQITPLSPSTFTSEWIKESVSSSFSSPPRLGWNN